MGGAECRMEETAMDVWREKVQQDINNLKINQAQDSNDIKSLREELSKLQMNDKIQDLEISSIKDDLKDIKGDTRWIRRTITGALISGGIVAAVGGNVALAITNVFGGG